MLELAGRFGAHWPVTHCRLPSKWNRRGLAGRNSIGLRACDVLGSPFAPIRPLEAQAPPEVLQTVLVSSESSRSGHGRTEWVLLLPPIDLLEHGLPHKISDSVEMVVAVNHPHEVIVVASLDAAGDGDLREDLLPRLR